MPSKPPNPKHIGLDSITAQQGVSLIELMLALTLGLVVSGAAFELFAHSLAVQRIQLAVSELQDDAVFQLPAIHKTIRKANLGSHSTMHQASAWTGIVLTGSYDNAPLNAVGGSEKWGNLRGVVNLNEQLFSRSNLGPSNLVAPTNSDQLTIQYQAAFPSFDCEGKKVHPGDMIIERFFTRFDRQRAANETKDLAIVLACDAGRYQLPTAIRNSPAKAHQLYIKDFGDNGVVLMNRVDYFGVQLGVRLKQGVSYMSIEQYLTQSSPLDAHSEYLYHAPIVSVQLGIISRASTAQAKSMPGKSVFYLQGKLHTIRHQHPSYLRRSLTSVVALRNSRESL